METEKKRSVCVIFLGWSSGQVPWVGTKMLMETNSIPPDVVDTLGVRRKLYALRVATVCVRRKSMENLILRQEQCTKYLISIKVCKHPYLHTAHCPDTWEHEHTRDRMPEQAQSMCEFIPFNSYFFCCVSFNFSSVFVLHFRVETKLGISEKQIQRIAAIFWEKMKTEKEIPWIRSNFV